MRTIVPLVLAACGAPAPAKPALPAPALPACPLYRLEMAPPEITKHASIAAARTALDGGLGDMRDEDPPGNAVGYSTMIRSFTGSARVYRDYALFATKSGALAIRLGDHVSVIPGPCGPTAQPELEAVEIVGSIGHVRYRRPHVTDASTLPDHLGPTGECARNVSYRIEDHLIDLEAGEYRMTLAQTYRADRVVPGHAVVIDPQGAGCTKDELLYWPLAFAPQDG